MLQNAYSLAKIGAETAENEQQFAEILPIGRRVAHLRGPARVLQLGRRPPHGALLPAAVAGPVPLLADQGKRRSNILAHGS